jgi:hypothetical protein
MNNKELVRLFDFVYDSIKTTGNIYPVINTRFVHFNPDYILTGKKKNSIANTLNGYHKKYININKILAAKQEITDPAIKITQKLIAEITGLYVQTVRKYFNSEPIDMDQVINDINHPITPVVITAITGIEFKEEYLKNIDNVTPENYIDPESSQWVCEYEFRNNQPPVN